MHQVDLGSDRRHSLGMDISAFRCKVEGREELGVRARVIPYEFGSEDHVFHAVV